MRESSLRLRMPRYRKAYVMLRSTENGNGVGFCMTMPTRERTASASSAAISWPDSFTSPVQRAFGTSSSVRFRHDSNVDLPQPDGPMMAVTRPTEALRSTSRKT